MRNSIILTAALLLGVGRAAIAQPIPVEPIPTETNTAAIDVAALVTHLQRINARLYATYWCPYCLKQQELFGDPDTLINADIYVECSRGGPHRATPWLCDLYRIESYPTWIIGGEHHVGLHSLQELAEISGFTGR